MRRFSDIKVAPAHGALLTTAWLLLLLPLGIWAALLLAWLGQPALYNIESRLPDTLHFALFMGAPLVAAAFATLVALLAGKGNGRLRGHAVTLAGLGLFLTIAPPLVGHLRHLL